MLETIKNIVFEVTGKNNVTLETDFTKDLMLSSFDVAIIVSKFEEMYDIDIPPRDVWNLHQAKDVIAYLKKRGVQ